MIERVAFTSRTNQAIEGALALPPGAGQAPGVVLLQEWWGVNDQIQSVAERLAAEGFVVVVPDLYRGKLARDAAEASALMNALDWPRAMDDIAGAVAYLKAHPRCTGKVAAMGFCMGGALTFVAACHVPEASAFAPFYGVARADYLDPARTHGPIQAHFARVDAFASPAKAEAVVAAINAADGRAELFTYDGGHAFMRASDPRAFHPDSAALAFERCTTFFRDTLGA